MTADPRIAATEAYMAAEDRLRRAARKAERTRRPATALDLRYYADMAHRAALAEEQDLPILSDK